MVAAWGKRNLGGLNDFPQEEGSAVIHRKKTALQRRRLFVSLPGPVCHLLQ